MTWAQIAGCLAAWIVVAGFLAVVVGRFIAGNVAEPRGTIVDHHPHQDMPRDMHLRLHRQVADAGMINGSVHAQRNGTGA